MITEIKEELGLAVRPEELKLIFSGQEDSKQVFFDIYYMQKDFDISNLKLQEEEVESVKWLSFKEIEALIKKGLFLENHAEELYWLKEFLQLSSTF